MKLALLALLLSAEVASAAPVACPKFMPCGTYEGKGAWYAADGRSDPEREFSERIVITALSKDSVNLKIWIYDQELGQPWADAIIKFKKDGAFTFSSKHYGTYGAGFCTNQTCSIAFRPVAIPAEKGRAAFVNSFSDTIRFEGNSLRRFNQVSNGMGDGSLHFQRSDLLKQ